MKPVGHRLAACRPHMRSTLPSSTERQHAVLRCTRGCRGMLPPPRQPPLPRQPLRSPMKAVRWGGLEASSLGKDFTLPFPRRQRFLGRKPRLPWRGLKNGVEAAKRSLESRQTGQKSWPRHEFKIETPERSKQPDPERPAAQAMQCSSTAVSAVVRPCRSEPLPRTHCSNCTHR